jgi:cell division protease FtsH
MDAKQHFSLWYFVAVVFMLLTVQSFLSNPRSQQIAYSDFQNLLLTGKVREVTIGDDQLTGNGDLSGLIAEPASEAAPVRPLDHSPSTAKPGDREFVVARVPDTNLVAELQAAKVKFSGRIENRWLGTLLSWIAPAVIFFAIWGLLIRRMGGGQMSSLLDVGKNKAKIYVQKGSVAIRG